MRLLLLLADTATSGYHNWPRGQDIGCRGTMASNTIGQLTEFDPTSDSVAAYVERTQLFFIANNIEENKQVAVFLSAIGPRTYKLLRDLMAPTVPKDKKLDEIISVMMQHYEPKPLVIAERFYFHRRQQNVGESIAEFVAELRRLATHCAFEAYLDEALRGRFVCGLRSEAMQKRLLTEADLTFSRAVEIARSMEMAAENVRNLQSSTGAAAAPYRDVCAIDADRSGTMSCYRCGNTNHKPAQCPCRTLKCHHCGKIGHIKSVCRQKDRPQRRTGKQLVKLVQEGTSADEPPQVLYQVRASADKPLQVDVELGGRHLCMEVDTGAARSILSEETYRSLFPELAWLPTTVKLHTYSGEPLTVLGEQEVVVRYGKQVRELQVLVVKGNGPSLMGRDWLRHIRLDWRAINCVRQNQLQDVLDDHDELFKPGLGTLKGFEAKIHVDPGVRPRFCKARTVPYALRDAVEQELERLVKEGII